MKWGSQTCVVLLCGSANGLRPPLRSEVDKRVDLGVPIEVVVLGGQRDVAAKVRACVERFPRAAFFLLRGDMLAYTATREVRMVFEERAVHTQGLRILPLRVSAGDLVSCVAADLEFLDSNPEDAATPYIVLGTRQVTTEDRLPIPNMLVDQRPRTPRRRTASWLVPAFILLSAFGVGMLADSSLQPEGSVATAGILVTPSSLTARWHPEAPRTLDAAEPREVSVAVTATHRPEEETTLASIVPTRANRTARVPKRRRPGRPSCREQREAVAAAREAREWKTVLDLVAPRCWPTEDEVASLRAEAFAATRRWDACVAAGRGVTSARVGRLVRDCEAKADRIASAQ